MVANMKSHLKMPLKYASQWFLPSIHCFKKISTYLSKRPISLSLNSTGLFSINNDCYWTSSQADEKHAICYNNSDRRFEIMNKTWEGIVLPVAAF